MYFINFFVKWFCPNFMADYTTVIGNKIYFPSKQFIANDEQGSMRILAHEMVHLLDQKRLSKPVFVFAYLFPQILVLGVFAFPWLGFWSLLFLLFLFPIPAPFRFYFEARAYAISLMTALPRRRSSILKHIVSQFTGWNYYKMYPFKKSSKRQLLKWYQKADTGKDKVLVKVLLIYEMVEEDWKNSINLKQVTFNILRNQIRFSESNQKAKSYVISYVGFLKSCCFLF